MGNNVEIWKDIPGFDGTYRVSNLGRVYSDKTNKFLTIREDAWGYPCVGLYGGGKMKLKKIHRILAELFIDNPNGKPCVNHIDGNKANNSISNLEWVTYSENTFHSKQVLGQCVLGDHHKSKLVLDTSTGIYYDTIKEAADAKGYSKYTLQNYLSGYRRNKTPLILA